MKKPFNHKDTRRKKEKNFVFLRVLHGKKLEILSIIILLSFLTSCANLPSISAPTEATTINPESISTLEIPATEIPTPEDNTPQILRVWLPPEFDPDAETDAGAILRARLDNFQKRRPDLIVEVRIKSTEGQASLLNALIATHQAAPSIMPDLVALPRPDFEKAAQEGILHPIDGLTTLLDDPDWFPYARPLAHIQNSAYGLPFSANLLGLRYTPTEDFPLPTLESLTEQEAQILFDPEKSELSFCLYLASGISLHNEEGQPALDEAELTTLLTFYQSDLVTEAESEKMLPVLWSDDFLDETPADARLMPIPGPKGSTCSLASAWLWSLAGSAPDLQPAAVELAEYLSDSTFLAEWTAALGTLPTRPTALDENETAFYELSLLAQPLPPNDIVEALGEIFIQATANLLEEGVSPEAAAKDALAQHQ
ncbi:MAG: hypothetical protein DRI32_03295 [Chloroflexi bacterium]|nr:MAG: hypothetical protein DRI32_03295 [Chloroflexota bacterium]